MSPADDDRASMRASDQDRERTAEVLRDAAGEGRLSMEELDERLAAVYTAKTYAELEPVVRACPGTWACWTGRVSFRCRFDEDS